MTDTPPDGYAYERLQVFINSELVEFVFLRCLECACMVSTADELGHRNWHSRIKRIASNAARGGAQVTGWGE